MPHSRKPSARAKRLAFAAGKPLNLVAIADVPTPEELIHRGIIDACRTFCLPGVLYWHPANEGLRSAAEGSKLKRLGLLPGVPDLVFHLPGGGTGFLEVKRPDGGRLSIDQKIFRDAAMALGCRWRCVESVSQAIEVLIEWGAIRPGVRVR